MTKWDIEPSGVSSVTSLVELAMDDVAKDIKSYGTHIQSAATSAGTTAVPQCGLVGPIGAALTLFAEKSMGDALFLGARAAKSVAGARAATGYYIIGALEQASNAQQEAAKAPDVEALLKAARKQGGGK